jgi:hypothetical protein
MHVALLNPPCSLLYTTLVALVFLKQPYQASDGLELNVVDGALEVDELEEDELEVDELEALEELAWVVGAEVLLETFWVILSGSSVVLLVVSAVAFAVVFAVVTAVAFSVVVSMTSSVVVTTVVVLVVVRSGHSISADTPSPPKAWVTAAWT